MARSIDDILENQMKATLVNYSKGSHIEPELRNQAIERLKEMYPEEYTHLEYVS